MINAITTALTNLLSMLGSVVTALVDSSGSLAPLLPLVGISIAGSVIFLAVRVVKKISWGY